MASIGNPANALPPLLTRETVTRKVRAVLRSYKRGLLTADELGLELSELALLYRGF